MDQELERSTYINKDGELDERPHKMRKLHWTHHQDFSIFEGHEQPSRVRIRKREIEDEPRLGTRLTRKCPMCTR